MSPFNRCYILMTGVSGKDSRPGTFDVFFFLCEQVVFLVQNDSQFIVWWFTAAPRVTVWCLCVAGRPVSLLSLYFMAIDSKSSRTSGCVWNTTAHYWKTVGAAGCSLKPPVWSNLFIVTYISPGESLPQLRSISLCFPLRHPLQRFHCCCNLNVVGPSQPQTDLMFPSGRSL